MSTIVKLNMIFDTTTMPDFGDITFDKNGNLMLTNSSVVKLITNLTQDVCGAAFNIPVGTKAIVADTGASFIYHANDRWYLSDTNKHNPESDAPAAADQSFWIHPKKYPAGYVQVKLTNNDVNYILTTETITITITANSTQILSKTLTKDDYMGDGYYAAIINLNEAKVLNNMPTYTIGVTIMNNGTDITQNITVSEECVIEWYDKIIKNGP